MKTLKILFVLILSFSFGFLHVSYAEQDDKPLTTIGSVLGSATGALIGYQFGGGRGKYATTAVGAVAGYVLGGKIQENLNNKEPEYQSDYGYPNDGYPNNNYPGQYNRPVYVGKDDYLIKQQQSDARKRRNMIRNGERDPLEMPYDTSEVQTSWDDPFN